MFLLCCSEMRLEDDTDEIDGNVKYFSTLVNLEI